ncbi:hypothetical protein C1H46_039154 [Malus baccata]|uniref:Syntaxin N-terminal domain-containing protein n=1 Tax=Malus baccata TaxID=106549 RepID=A0A540KM59_MALBA|nr:hypothetical protein C1H46_039154 [Malus baccata]
MNDLMTKSFLSYVELKKQAQKDLEADLDVETGAGKLNPSGQENLSQFFQEVGAIKADMEEITNLLHDLHCLNEEAKSTHSANILRGLRDLETGWSLTRWQCFGKRRLSRRGSKCLISLMRSTEKCPMCTRKEALRIGLECPSPVA